MDRLLQSRLGFPAWLSVLTISGGLMVLVILPLTMLALKAFQELPGAKMLLWAIQDHGLSIPSQITSHSAIWSHIAPELQKLGLASPEQPDHLSIPDHLSARLAPVISGNHSGLIHMMLAAGRHTTHLLEQALFTFIGFVAFLSGGELLAGQITRLSQNLIGDNGPSHVEQMGRAIRGTVTGIVLIGIVQGLAISIALMIWDCPHPALFTSLIIAAGLIPFCAPLALAASAIAAFFSAGTTSAIAIAIWGLTVIFLADHLIKPKLVGHSTRLGFLASMIAILGGLKTMGLIGIFIGPALFSVGATIWKEFTETPNDGSK